MYYSGISSLVTSDVTALYFLDKLTVLSGFLIIVKHFEAPVKLNHRHKTTRGNNVHGRVISVVRVLGVAGERSAI